MGKAKVKPSKHGIKPDGDVEHEFGCVPRAISMIYGEDMGMDYEEIVGSLYKSARRNGHFFTFHDQTSGGLQPEDFVDFCRRHDLRVIMFGIKPPVPAKDILRFWSSWVGITDDHAVPYLNGKQLPNPHKEKSPRFYYIITSRPWLYSP